MTVSRDLFFRFYQFKALKTSHGIDSHLRQWRKRATGFTGRGLLIALASAVLFLGLAAPQGAFAAPELAVYAQALAQFQAGQYRQAADLLNGELKKTPANAASEILLARCYYEMSDWDTAIQHAQSAAQIDPSDAEAHVWLGQALGRKAESRRSFPLALKARREFEQAVALGPSDVDARRDLMEFYLEAPWILGGSKAKARKQVDAISSFDSVQGTLARAQYDSGTGDDLSAQAEYRHVLDLKPAHVGPYLEVADNAVAHKDVSELNAAVSGAAQVNPSDPRLAYYRGVAQVLEGQRPAQAEHELKSYVAHAPDRHDYPSHASALSWLGTLYERLGRPNLAMIEYQSALQLDPDFPAARQAILRLKSK